MSEGQLENIVGMGPSKEVSSLKNIGRGRERIEIDATLSMWCPGTRNFIGIDGLEYQLCVAGRVDTYHPSKTSAISLLRIAFTAELLP